MHLLLTLCATASSSVLRTRAEISFGDIRRGHMQSISQQRRFRTTDRGTGDPNMHRCAPLWLSVSGYALRTSYVLNHSSV